MGCALGKQKPYQQTLESTNRPQRVGQNNYQEKSQISKNPPQKEQIKNVQNSREEMKISQIQQLKKKQENQKIILQQKQQFQIKRQSEKNQKNSYNQKQLEILYQKNRQLQRQQIQMKQKIKYLQKMQQSMKQQRQNLAIKQKSFQCFQKQKINLEHKARELEQLQSSLRQKSVELKKQQMMIKQKHQQLELRQRKLPPLRLKDESSHPQEFIEQYLDTPALKSFRTNFQLKGSLQQKWKVFLLKGVQEKRCDIKELDLSSKDQFKIGAQVEQLTKVELPHVTSINIQNNLIKDEGVKILCEKANMPSLKKINLEDNGITMSGVSSLINNKWDKKVNYELSSVQQEGKIRLHVGEHIPLIKSIIDTKTVCQIDELIPTQENKNLNALNLLLVTPLEESYEKSLNQESRKLEEKYVSMSQTKQISVPHLMLALKQRIGDSLKFTTKAGTKTHLTSKIIFTGIIEERIKFSHRFQKLKNFKFSDFKGNHRKLKQFQAWYFEYIKKQYGVNTSNMTIDSVVEGSIIVHVSDSSVTMLTQNKKYLQKVSDQVKIFFESLHLNQSQFDFQNNFAFPKVNKGSIQKRGGLPYYQPVHGVRFGIKVLNLYKDNNWLMMDGNKEQWAVAFHGVNNPTSLIFNDKNEYVNKIRSIFDGRQKGIMLRQGNLQGFQTSKCIKSNQIVGKGVYVSPYFLVCLLQFSRILPGEKYHVVLQCRAKPASIKICGGMPSYWVVNKRQDLRPYGVILFTDEQYKQFLRISAGQPLKGHKQIFGAQFTDETWRTTYQKQYKQFHK